MNICTNYFRNFGFGFLLLLLGASTCAASADFPKMLWISTVPPQSAGSDLKMIQKNADASESTLETDSAYSVSKRFWFCQGDQVNAPEYLGTERSPTIEMLDSSAQRRAIVLREARKLAQVHMELPEKGFYNLYARREGISGNTLWVQIAKAEIVRGTFRDNDVDLSKMKAISDSEQPLEIVREHPDKEKLFTRIVSGDRVDFTVLSHGLPAKGIPVAMITQQGWEKKLLSDENGHVSFTIIRDYFPPWQEFRRRTRESFVVVADREIGGISRVNGQSYNSVHYQATLSGRYALSPRDYSSYAFGLGVAVFVATFSGLAIYLYRRRRVKPFHEIRFDGDA